MKDDEYDAYDTYQPGKHHLSQLSSGIVYFSPFEIWFSWVFLVPDEFEEDFKTPTRPSSTNAAALQKILHNMDEEPVQRSASPEKSAATPMPQIQVTPQMIRRVFNVRMMCIFMLPCFSPVLWQWTRMRRLQPKGTQKQFGRFWSKDVLEQLW